MLETHVTNLEQSRKLYELGFVKPSIYMRGRADTWDKEGDTYMLGATVPYNLATLHPPYPAYLLSEIMEFCPDKIETEEYSYWLEIYKSSGYVAAYVSTSDPQELYAIRKNTPTVAACDLLIWCIENGFISVS